MFKKNMGPMGPRGLGPWALWGPGALGPKNKNNVVRQNENMRSNYVVRKSRKIVFWLLLIRCAIKQCWC